MTYKQIKINITKEQLTKALKGQPIQFKASQLGVGNTYLSLHPANIKIVEKSALRGKGCILNIAPGELLATAEDNEMSGNGLFGDIWSGLKSGYKFVKKNVIDTPIYQEAIRPLVRQGVNVATSAAKAFVPGLSKPIDALTEEISRKTGAFGVKHTKQKRKELLQARGLYLS